MKDENKELLKDLYNEGINLAERKTEEHDLFGLLLVLGIAAIPLMSMIGIMLVLIFS